TSSGTVRAGNRPAASTPPARIPASPASDPISQARAAVTDPAAYTLGTVHGRGGRAATIAPASPSQPRRTTTAPATASPVTPARAPAVNAAVPAGIVAGTRARRGGRAAGPASAPSAAGSWSPAKPSRRGASQNRVPAAANPMKPSRLIAWWATRKRLYQGSAGP